MDSVPFETLDEGGMSRRAKSDPILRERSSRFQQKVELSIEKFEREGGLTTALYIGRLPLRAV